MKEPRLYAKLQVQRTANVSPRWCIVDRSGLYVDRKGRPVRCPVECRPDEYPAWQKPETKFKG